MSLQEYRAHIASLSRQSLPGGIMGADLNAGMKEHQRASVEFALSHARTAMFLDTGLGKSFCQLEWARCVAEETGKPVLILTPLAVAGQMVREGRKFGIDARQIKYASEVTHYRLTASGSV